MNKIKQLLTLLCLLISFPAYGKPTPTVKNAVKAAALVVVKGQGSGSGFEVYQQDNLTLIMTNDHVCQMTRGKVFLSQKVDYSNKLNTLPIEVVDLNDKVHKGKVIKTSNLHSLDKSHKGSDLCLVAIEGKLPGIAQFSDEPLEIGDKVFAVGAPHGIFPLVHEGYLGPGYVDDDDNEKEVRVSSLLLWPGSSGSAVYDMDTGLVVGVVFAILPVEKDIDVPVVTIIVPGDQAKDFLDTYLKKA